MGQVPDLAMGLTASLQVFLKQYLFQVQPDRNAWAVRSLLLVAVTQVANLNRCLRLLGIDLSFIFLRVTFP
jgi:hypothetical protein